jgi:competence ComEA-like helix-hairpin-helix protein
MQDQRDGHAGFAVLSVLLIVGIVWAGAHRATRPIIRSPNDVPASIPTSGGQLPDMRLDLNRASAAELTLLPGIGERLAERIVDEREHGGAFHTVDDLQRVRGIGPLKVKRLRPYVVLDGIDDTDGDGESD